MGVGGNINISRSLIHMRQGKGKKDQYLKIMKELLGHNNIKTTEIRPYNGYLQKSSK